MFDTLRCLWAGFSGQLRGYGEARKLIWLLLIAFIAGWLAAAFAAWVSFPSYRAMISFLPGATVIAWGFTLSIAGFLYFDLAYLAGFFVERWKGIPLSVRNYTTLGARILGICAIVFLAVDVSMNLQGTYHRASEAAGDLVTFEYQTPPDRSADMKADRETLSKLQAGELGGYGWKDQQGTYHLNNSGKRYQRALSAQIKEAQEADKLERAAALKEVNEANAQRAAIQAKAESSLKGGVYGVYVFILLLGFVQAYIVETIQNLTGQNTPAAPAEAPARPQVKRSAPKAGKPTFSSQQAPSGLVTAQNQNDGPQAQARPQQPAGEAQGELPQYGEAQAQGGGDQAQGEAQAGPLAKVPGGWMIVCKNCGQHAVMKSHLAKYCGDECRQEHWENRTGRKLKKGGFGSRKNRIGYK